MHLHEVLLVPRIYLIRIMFRSTCPTSNESVEINSWPLLCLYPLYTLVMCMCLTFSPQSWWIKMHAFLKFKFKIFNFKHNKMYFCIQPYTTTHTHTQIIEQSCINWMHRETVYSAYSCILLFLLHMNLQTFSFSKLQIRDIKSSVSQCNVHQHDQSWHKASWFNGFQKWYLNILKRAKQMY